MDQVAAEVTAGAGGVLFLPHLSGERSPFTDPMARGAWVGLSASSSRAHLARAVLEGVAFNFRAIADSLVRSLRLTHSPWCVLINIYLAQGTAYAGAAVIIVTGGCAR